MQQNLSDSKIKDDRLLFDADNFYNQYELDLCQKLIKKTIETLPVYMEELRKAYQQRNFNQLKRIAHTLKGMANSIFTPALKEIAYQIEKAASDKNNDKIESGMNELKNIYQPTFSMLKNQLKQKKRS
jgi:HPt (histidine-containing phosphotransfer) domain-containing protein